MSFFEFQTLHLHRSVKLHYNNSHIAGHCKSLAPIWDQIAEKYADKKDLVIAKVDGTENEVDGVEVEGFPTLIMYKKETNEAVDYTGEFNPHSMRKKTNVIQSY